MADPKKEAPKSKKTSPEYKGEGLSDKVTKRMAALSERLEEKGAQLEEVIGDKAKKLGETIDKGGDLINKAQGKWQNAREQSAKRQSQNDTPVPPKTRDSNWAREMEEGRQVELDSYQKLCDALDAKNGNIERDAGTCPDAIENDHYYMLMTAPSLATEYAPHTDWAQKSAQQLSRIFNKAVENKETMEIKQGKEKTYPAYLVDSHNGCFYDETPQILAKLSTKFNAAEMHDWFMSVNKTVNEKPADMMATAHGRLKVKSMARSAAR